VQLSLLSGLTPFILPSPNHDRRGESELILAAHECRSCTTIGIEHGHTGIAVVTRIVRKCR